MVEQEEETVRNVQDEHKTERQPVWKVLIKSPMIWLIPVFVYLFFFGENSYMIQTENNKKINELKAEIKMNIDSADYYEQKAKALDTDPESLEKIAREQYMMKCADEDVYITPMK